jgi:hypothetical protein
MTGISSSGKTTFLAALWETLNSPTAPAGTLQLREQPADRQYFFEIGQTWLKFKELGHSNIDAPRHTEMPLLDPAGAPFDLRIPDVVGESFASAWEGKDWPDEVAKIARASNGLLMFVHGGKVVPPIQLPRGEPLYSSEIAAGPTEETEWKPSEAPTQTKLADLLEGVHEICSTIPTVVVVSAWDEVRKKTDATPETWLQLNLPLLWQMLECRHGAEPYTVFGISAQGGDVTDPEEHARLAAMKPAHERIIVQQGTSVGSDISAPIRWLLDQTT